MFAIDFTKPWLYKDVIYFNQGNLATNNILRCKLITGGDTTLEGYIATVTFKTLSHTEINTSVNIVDDANCVIDIKFPSNSLEVGVNELEVLLNKGDGNDKVVVQSPKIKYEVWQGLTTGNGIQGDNNYPILIDLMSEVNNAVKIANNAVDKANTSLNKANKMISDTNNVITKANEAIDNTNNAKDKALEVIDEVEKAIAAGTQDLEVKKARKDSFGVTHDSLFQRLENDLKIDKKPLKQEVLDLAGLKEVQEISYDSTTVPNYNGYMVCEETKNGTVKDLKLSGKSLINKATIDIALGHTNTNTGEALSTIRKGFTSNYRNAKPSTEYVAKFKNIVSNKARIIIILFNGDRRLTEVKSWSTDISEMKFTTTQETNRIVISVVCDDAEVSSQTLQEVKKLYQPLLLDSNEVDLCNGYFEGITSVGTGVDKIEVSSTNNGNILNSELVKAAVRVDNGNLNNINGAVATITQQEIIPVIPNMKLYYKSIGERAFRSGGNTFLYKYGRDNNFLGRENLVTFEPINIPSDCYGVRVMFNDFELSRDYPASKYGVVFSQFEIFVDSHVKKDKKNLLFKDTDNTWKPIKELRGLKEVCDTVELHSDGKYYYHTRTEKKLYSPGDEDNPEVITDKTNTIAKLAKEKVFEVNPLFLEAYEGGTLIFGDSGVVNTPMEFKIASYISNLVLLNQKRIKDLENEIYKSQDMQDIMILENDLRLMDIEFALMESMPIKLNLRSDDMFRGVTEFEFLKGRILSGSHTDEYLEKCINKYKKAGRLTDEEYDILYDMIYPPVYDILAEK